MKNKTEFDYLNFNDLNEIENTIDYYNDKLKIISNIPDFIKKDWQVDELPFIQEIDRIEKGIYNLGEYYVKPKGWIESKDWLQGNFRLKSFDYNDYNRWVNNLTLFEVLLYTIWNGVSFVQWGIKSDIDWS